MERRKFLHSLGVLSFAAAAPGILRNCDESGTEPDSIQEPVNTDLFISGEGGYPRYRITSMVVTGNGTVLAFSQGRQEGGDNAQNDLVLRRSTDGGETWEPMQMIAEDGDRALTPHCSLVDYETGRVILVTGSFPDGCHADCIEPGYTGDKILRVYQMQSDDEGQTWSDMREITRQVRHPAPFVGGRCGSGMGIQLRREPYKGRLILPTNNKSSEGGSEVCAVYSDDHGETWQRGGFAPRHRVDSGPNETQMVELQDGTIMLNTRAEGSRKIAFSYDGGESWSTLRDEPDLVDSSCNASIIRYSDPLDDERSRILFSNPASRTSRVNGTVRLSYDEGDTWPVAKTLYSGDFGYSSLTRLPNGDVGILYERDKLERGVWRALTFGRFTLDWLTDGQDQGVR